MQTKVRIAVLDDYQGVALQMADWSFLKERAEIVVFNDHLDQLNALAERLQPFEVVNVMRERTPLPRALLERLPNLRLIASTGPRNTSIDVDAARDLGIQIAHTGYVSDPTIEFAWALILASARDIVGEAKSVRDGGWQRSVGVGLRGKTLGLLGLGIIGREVARIAQAFGMTVVAWSQNLTLEQAAAVGAVRVEKDELFAQADFLTIHLVLSARTRGLVDARMLALMRPTAHLINTSRGPIVDEAALLDALREGRIAGAAIDVFETEPLPPDHPFRSQPNLLATPHLGYVSEELYRTFYGDTVRNIRDWLEKPS
jgi:phosphoglycerate dehydrogenase-like enzyme